MKTNKMNRLITGALTTLAGLGVVGSIGGTYAWYTYNTKATASIYGTSVSSTRNLQVRLNNESGDTWRHDITSSEVNTASGALGHSDDGQLKAVSSYNGRNMVGNPISHSIGESATSVTDYYEFRINFRETIVGDPDKAQVANKNVYISRVVAEANYGSTDVTGAIRVAFFSDINHFVEDSSHVKHYDEPEIFAPAKDSDGSINLYGTLDLDDENGADTQFSDKIGVATGDREFEWEKNPDAWDITKAYQINALVKYTDGKVYKAKVAMAANTAWNANNWQLMTNEIIYGVTKDYEVGEDYSVGDKIYYSPNAAGTAGAGFIVNEAFTATDWSTDYDKCSILEQEYLGRDSVITEIEGGSGSGSIVGSEGLVVAKTNDNIRDFNEKATYAVGDYVYYNGKAYKCNTAITTPGAWVASSWGEVGEFSSTVAYTAGAWTYLNGILYRARVDIEAGKEFNPAQWKVDSSQVTIRVWLEGWDTSINDLSNGAGFKLGFQFETLN